LFTLNHLGGGPLLLQDAALLGAVAHAQRGERSGKILVAPNGPV
jgi:hypothetical protein